MREWTKISGEKRRRENEGGGNTVSSIFSTHSSSFRSLARLRNDNPSFLLKGMTSGQLRRVVSRTFVISLSPIGFYLAT